MAQTRHFFKFVWRKLQYHHNVYYTHIIGKGEGGGKGSKFDINHSVAIGTALFIKPKKDGKKKRKKNQARFVVREARFVCVYVCVYVHGCNKKVSTETTQSQSHLPL